MNEVKQFDNKFVKYNEKYLSFSVELFELPESLIVEDKTLVLRSSFHVSLMCVKNVLNDYPDAEDIVLDTFKSFLKKYEINFSDLTGEFRLATIDERVSVVAMCEISNLKYFFDDLNKRLGSSIPYQPTHITLYTLQPDAGIGLNSQAELERLSKQIIISDEISSSVKVK